MVVEVFVETGGVFVVSGVRFEVEDEELWVQKYKKLGWQVIK